MVSSFPSKATPLMIRYARGVNGWNASGAPCRAYARPISSTDAHDSVVLTFMNHVPKR